MPAGGIKSVGHGDILSYEDTAHIIRILAADGISRVKLTGGEPLVRKDICEAVRMIRGIEGIDEITLTTNGVLLESMLDELISAGISSVNISLDTLDPEYYRQITRVGELDTVLSALDACLGAQLRTKINCVPLTDENDILALARLARDNELHVRFIEKMPFGPADADKYFPKIYREDEIRSIIEKSFGRLTPCGERLGNGPAVYYSLEGFKGKIGFISAMSHSFCSSCSRLRLTSTGFLKTCLYYGDGVDLGSMLLEPDSVIEKAVLEAVSRKRAGHRFGEDARKDAALSSLSTIGG